MDATNSPNSSAGDTSPGSAEVLRQEIERLKATLIEQEKLANIGVMTAGILHEIKNPLNFVMTFSKVSLGLVEELNDVIEKVKPVIDGASKDDLEDISDTFQANLVKINANGERAIRIMTNMLAQARTDTPITFVKTDINQMVDEFVKLAYQGARGQDSSFNVSLKTAYDTRIGEVNVDAHDLSRVILNIVNNACYAVNDKKKKLDDPVYNPQISITTQKEPNSFVVYIRDNGPGMPDEVIAKIFNPFFTTKPTGEGTGLGLSMSYDIITRIHMGTLEVTAEPGIYTEFVITIPIK